MAPARYPQPTLPADQLRPYDHAQTRTRHNMPARHSFTFWIALIMALASLYILPAMTTPPAAHRDRLAYRAHPCSDAARHQPQQADSELIYIRAGR